MNLREDWGEYAAILSGVLAVLLGIWDMDLLFIVLGLIIIHHAHLVVQQRGTIRELRQE